MDDDQVCDDRLMLSGPSSILRNLPEGGYRQTLYLDGLRYCLDAVDESFFALRGQLANLENELNLQSTKGERIEAPVAPVAATRAAIHAWGCIDWLDRLRKVMGQTPGLPTGQDPQLRRLLKSFDEVGKFRNYYQHLNGAIEKGIASGVPQPVLGSLAWSTLHSRMSATAYLLQFGTQLQGAGSLLSLTVDGTRSELTDAGILLHAYGGTLNLTNSHARVSELAQHLDTSLEVINDADQSATAASDVLVGLTISLGATTDAQS